MSSLDAPNSYTATGRNIETQKSSPSEQLPDRCICNFKPALTKRPAPFSNARIASRPRRRPHRLPRTACSNDYLPGNPFALRTPAVFHRVANVLHKHFDARVENHRADIRHTHTRLASLEKDPNMDFQSDSRDRSLEHAGSFFAGDLRLHGRIGRSGHGASGTRRLFLRGLRRANSAGDAQF